VLGITMMNFHCKNDRRHKAKTFTSITKAGFVQVDTPEQGDLIVIAIGSLTPCHGAIWLNGDVRCITSMGA